MLPLPGFLRRGFVVLVLFRHDQRALRMIPQYRVCDYEPTELDGMFEDNGEENVRTMLRPDELWQFLPKQTAWFAMNKTNG